MYNNNTKGFNSELAHRNSEHVYGFAVVRWEDGKPEILNKFFDTKKKAENFIKKTEDDATYTIEAQDSRMRGFLYSICKDDSFANYFVGREDEELFIQLGDLKIKESGAYFTDAPDPYKIEEYAFFVRAESLIIAEVVRVYGDSETGTAC